MVQQFTLGRKERLKSRKLIEQVFGKGKSFTVFPYKTTYLLIGRDEVRGGGASLSGLRDRVPDGGVPLSGPRVGVPDVGAPLQAGFGVSSRHFKRAVDRNRIKRLGREAYRVQKQALAGQLREKGISMAVFFVFMGKELPDHATVSGKIGVILQRLMKEVV